MSACLCREIDEVKTLLTATVDDNRPAVDALLKADAGLATRFIAEPKLYESGIFHWTYVGDTALHLAAAGYRVETVELHRVVSSRFRAAA